MFRSKKAIKIFRVAPYQKTERKPEKFVVLKQVTDRKKNMIIENINSQTWPQTKWVISISIFQIIVIALFCIFVRYDASLDSKLADPKVTTSYDAYPCK